MGRRKEFPFYLLIVPFAPAAVIVFRDRSITANRELKNHDDDFVDDDRK